MTFTDAIILLVIIVIIFIIVYFSFIKDKNNHCKGCPYCKTCEKKNGNQINEKCDK